MIAKNLTLIAKNLYLIGKLYNFSCKMLDTPAINEKQFSYGFESLFLNDNIASALNAYKNQQSYIISHANNDFK